MQSSESVSFLEARNISCFITLDILLALYNLFVSIDQTIRVDQSYRPIDLGLRTIQEEYANNKAKYQDSASSWSKSRIRERRRSFLDTSAFAPLIFKTPGHLKGLIIDLLG